jgi:FkbM family methyltransferase
VSAQEVVGSALRSLQTLAPWSADAKHALKRAVRAVVRRPHDRDFLALRLLGFGPEEVCVDGGANRGQSIQSMQLLLARPRIVAFEANPELAAVLVRRYAHDPSVRVEPTALGDQAGTFVLHLPVYRGFAFDGLASLDEDEAAGWLPGRLLGFDEAKLEIRHVTCTAATLDSFELAPGFVKLDVQGREHQVLLGGLQTIRRHRPVLLVESPPPASFELLGSLGYRAMSYEHGALVAMGAMRTNTFFVPEERPLQGAGR